MNWIGILLLIIHIAACTGLILVVLLQAGKGASLGAAFGGGSSQTLFGAQSATFIGRATWVAAVVFMLTSLLLTMISPWGDGEMESGSSILQQEPIASPPLGQESHSAIPETASDSDDFSVDTGIVHQEEAQTAPADAPIESPVQPEPEASAVAPDADALSPETSADTVAPEPEQH
jgi:preprotein translocase subunit SecG